MDTTTSAAAAISPADRRFMDRAVQLGRHGWGRVQPNPMVGCVIVRRGEVVAEGWHREFGGPHAEIVALSEAREDAKGATAYVSLEPCRHRGKTPPCSAALREAGIRRVVFGAADPWRESGGGAADLRAGGVEVAGPLLTERDGRWENPGFFSKASDRPWVALKLAVSLDARISAEPGVRTEISGGESNAQVQWLRAGFDAILVGTNTALVDDPLLSVRGEVSPRVPPRRVILDAAGKVSPSARVLAEGSAPVSFFTTSAGPASWRAGVEARGGMITEVPAESSGRVSLSAVLATLYEDGVQTLLCEGGGRVGSELLGLGVVDRVYLIIAPRFMGLTGVLAFPDAPATHWGLGEEPRRFGDDVWMVLEPKID